MAANIIHVHQQRIKGNCKKNPEDREPPIIIKNGQRTVSYGNHVDVIEEATGRVACSFFYKHDEPLNCGARVYAQCAEGFKAINRSKIKEAE